MDLFSNDILTNLLPYDGEVNYYGKVMTHQKAKDYFDSMYNNIEWRNDEAIIFGKRIITKRKVAWYGDDGYSYSYSNTTKQALKWTRELLELKQLVETSTGFTFNSCLMNLYHNGDEGVSWHSDDEKTLARHAPIASLSFGAERKFCFKHKRTAEGASIILEHGSLLIMKGTTQTNWLHAIPKSKKIIKPRISLTFRTILPDIGL